VSDGAEGPAMLWCRLCEKARPAGLFCSLHPGEELVPLPDGAGDVSGGTVDDETDLPRTVCWKCRTASKDVTNATCTGCHESLVPPALVIEFPDGSVVVRTRETSAELGRAGTYGRVFARYPNVSRWHATISVDEQGDAWLTPNPAAPNGTFVNGSEIVDRTAVRPGDQIRFATDGGPSIGPVSERIRQPQQEPVSVPDE
jgi:hypothetical protein